VPRPVDLLKVWISVPCSLHLQTSLRASRSSHKSTALAIISTLTTHCLQFDDCNWSAADATVAMMMSVHECQQALMM